MFIGQKSLLKELGYIVESARAGTAFNLLFSARTGYGKTHLAMTVISHVSTYQVFLETSAEKIRAGIEECKAHSYFVDEVHLVKNIELLYPLMDSGKYFLLFATNMGSELPEAFKRRCIVFPFARYSKTELERIAELRLSRMNVEPSCFEEIVRASNYTPGNIVTLCLRLEAIFRGRAISLKELREVLEDVIDIQDGLDSRCREYLETLEKLGGTASLDVITHVLGMSKDTVKFEIEPVLLSKNLILISAKGRSLCHQ